MELSGPPRQMQYQPAFRVPLCLLDYAVENRQLQIRSPCRRINAWRLVSDDIDTVLLTLMERFAGLLIIRIQALLIQSIAGTDHHSRDVAPLQHAFDASILAAKPGSIMKLGVDDEGGCMIAGRYPGERKAFVGGKDGLFHWRQTFAQRLGVCLFGCSGNLHNSEDVRPSWYLCELYRRLHATE